MDFAIDISVEQLIALRNRIPDSSLDWGSSVSVRVMLEDVDKLADRHLTPFSHPQYVIWIIYTISMTIVAMAVTRYIGPAASGSGIPVREGHYRSFQEQVLTATFCIAHPLCRS